MGLFDFKRSSSVKQPEGITDEYLDELVSSVNKNIQEIYTAASGGEKDQLDEKIEKRDLSFLEKLGASKSFKEGLQEAPIMSVGGGRTIKTKDFDENLSKEDLETQDELRKAYTSGLAKAGYSIADIVASFVDLSGKTNLSEKLDKIYLEADIEEPETTLGQVSALLVEYGIPTGIAFKVLQKVKQLPKIYRKLRKLPEPVKKPPTKIGKLAGAMGLGAAGIGLGEFLAGSREAVDPFQDEKLQDLEGLTGRDLAIAKFKNRLLYAQEGAVIGGLFPLIGKAATTVGAPIVKTTAGVTLNTAGKAFDFASWLLANAGNIPGAKEAVKGVKTVTGKIPNINPVSRVVQIYANRGTGQLFKTLPPFKEWRKFDINSTDPVKRRLKQLDSNLLFPVPVLKKFKIGLDAFRSAGRLTPEEFAFRGGAEKYIKRESKIVSKALDSIEKNTYRLAKDFAKQYDTKQVTPALQESQLELVLQYLKGQKKLKDLPEVIRESSKVLNDSLMNIKKRYAGVLPDGELKDFMLNDLRSYLRKSFSFFTNKYYVPDLKLKDDAIAWVQKNVIEANKDLAELAIKKFPSLTREQALKEAARIRVESILTRGNYEGKDPLQALQFISKQKLRMDKLIATGDELPDVIKRLLGEESNLRGSVLSTVSDMLVQDTKKILYDNLGQIGLKQKWLFRTADEAELAGVANPEQIHKLAGLTSLETDTAKLYASKEIAENLRTGKQLFDTAIQNDLYLSFLSLKGITQYGLTVLSPATQVRNVLSASMFSLFNGHLGGRASVTDAFKMVVNDIFGAGKIINEKDFIERIARKIELGVIDENVIATELKSVLEDINNNSIRDTKTLLERLGNAKFTKKATELYGGGDNLWKFFGHEFVMSQLKPAITTMDDVIKYHRDIMKTEFNKINPFTGAEKTLDDAIEEMAAWSVRNTYPTYSMVPPVIQAIRKLPLGNFVAFPAEMWRTSFNALELAMREISSSNTQIRQMGFRRLLGASSVFGGFGVAIPLIGETITGISQEFMDKYTRDYGASWEKTSDLVPVTKMKDGKFKYINLSYFNPYSTVTAPLIKLYDIAFGKKGDTPEKAEEGLAYDLFNLESGAITELLKPFLSEAIIVEKVLDILPAGYGGRGGVTKTGRAIYSDSDSWGVKYGVKSFGHLIEGIQPGATRTLLRIGQGFEGNKYIDPYNELANLFSGIKFQEADILDKMNFVVNDYLKIPNETKVNLDFYKADNWNDQTPDKMVLEYIDQQNEAFRQQYKIYQAVQTALESGLSKQEVFKALTKADRISKKKANALIDGRFMPIPIADGRMKSKLEELKKLEEKRGVTVFTAKRNKDWYYPIQQFNEVFNKFNNMSFKSVDEQKDILESIQESLDVDTIIEEMDIDSMIKDIYKNLDMDFQSSNQEIQTPPLPETPKPDVASATNLASINVVNPMTGLTRTEGALLSPGEQAIAQKSNRRIV